MVVDDSLLLHPFSCFLSSLAVLFFVYSVVLWVFPACDLEVFFSQKAACVSVQLPISRAGPPLKKYS